MRRVGFALGVLCLGFVLPVSSLEPLRITLDAFPATEKIALPPGVEARYFALMEDSVAALPRFAIQNSISTADARLEYGVVDYVEERIWVPDEDQSEDDEGGEFFQWFGRVLFGWLSGRSAKATEKGQWMYDASLVVRARLVSIEENGKHKRFTLTSEARAESSPAVRAAVLEALAPDVDGELRRLFILRGASTRLDDRSVAIDLGSELGVEPGMIFRVADPETAGALSLARVTSSKAGDSVADVVRRHGTDNSSGSARELVDNPADFRADLVFDLPAGRDRPGSGNDTSSVSASITVVLAPYSPVYGGGGIRIFSVDDSRERQDAGFGLLLFAGYQIVQRPRVRTSATIHGGVDLVFRPDDADESTSTALLTLAPGIETSVVLTPDVDAVIGGGYRFATTSDSWQVITDEEGEETRRGTFDGSAPAVSTRGPFAFIGLRYCFY